MAGNKGPQSLSIDPPSTGVARIMERKRQNSWVGIGQFNRITNEANSNHNNTDKKNIKNSEMHRTTLTVRCLASSPSRD